MFIISLIFLAFATITPQFINNTYICYTQTGLAFPFKRKLFAGLLSHMLHVTKRKQIENSILFDRVLTSDHFKNNVFTEDYIDNKTNEQLLDCL